MEAHKGETPDRSKHVLSMKSYPPLRRYKCCEEIIKNTYHVTWLTALLEDSWDLRGRDGV